MANLKDIRTRIDSVTNTQQITRAMKMVSAAKLRKAQNAIVNLRPYAIKLRETMTSIAESENVTHPLLEKDDKNQKTLAVVLTSDRGLCGGFNNNVNKFALEYYEKAKAENRELDLYFIGTKGRDFFKYRDIHFDRVLPNLSKEISYTLAAKIADSLMNEFVEGEYGRIIFIYNQFQSAIAQHVVSETLLPVETLEQDETEKTATSTEYLFEPDPKEMVDELLKKHFSTQVYRCMCESVAAEHGARMTSMENATKNAGEMISKLTLTYNKVRQAAITTELIEITSGAEALKG